MDPTTTTESTSIAILPLAVYGGGMAINTLINMHQYGLDELETYNKNKEVQKEQVHRSEYTAYWSGCRTGLLYSAIDSVIWPIKLSAFAFYLVRKNSEHN
jgi:hypothetical protein